MNKVPGLTFPINSNPKQDDGILKQAIQFTEISRKKLPFATNSNIFPLVVRITDNIFQLIFIITRNYSS